MAVFLVNAGIDITAQKRVRRITDLRHVRANMIAPSSVSAVKGFNCIPTALNIWLCNHMQCDG
ncbi:hypothetical protein PG984_015077 [Apiospora sp. TS-2023a]